MRTQPCRACTQRRCSEPSMYYDGGCTCASDLPRLVAQRGISSHTLVELKSVDRFVGTAFRCPRSLIEGQDGIDIVLLARSLLRPDIPPSAC